MRGRNDDASTSSASAPQLQSATTTRRKSNARRCLKIDDDVDELSSSRDAAVESKSKQLMSTSKIATTNVQRHVYQLIDVSTIQLFADAQGYSSQDVSIAGWNLLSEDLNYRLRHLTHLAAKFVKHSKRSYMTCIDIDRALHEVGQLPLYGHSQIDSPKVHYMKDVGLFARYEGVVDLGALALSTTHCSSMPTTSRFIISGQLLSAAAKTTDEPLTTIDET